ncbi:hypothetical protein DERF_014305 [Dermatophagoides farinae]|uniref:Uncharacterized protein n=1 Tax=Dermatophagoides farinae TaxID=6954 RepID=A0A922HLY5_DERFA|nr:hypothetical protein DERF_014305 [Dermatophagoides farinae]
MVDNAPTSSQVTSGTVAKPSRFEDGCIRFNAPSKSHISMWKFVSSISSIFTSDDDVDGLFMNRSNAKMAASRIKLFRSAPTYPGVRWARLSKSKFESTLMLRNKTPNASTSNDLPTPGGPCSKNPRGASTPNFRYKS